MDLTDSGFINLLINKGLLYDILINNDGSWGENINDWKIHYEILVNGNYFDDNDDDDAKYIPHLLIFMIQYLVEKTNNISEYKIPCRWLYNEYIKWCDTNDEYLINKRKFGRFLSSIGIQRSRTAEERLYTINRNQLIDNIINEI